MAFGMLYLELFSDSETFEIFLLVGLEFFLEKSQKCVSRRVELEKFSMNMLR
jgi:hypothetical protein